MISVLYVNILIGVLICLFPCMLSWFLGSMCKHIFDLSRSIWLKSEKEIKHEKHKVLQYLREEVRLGISSQSTELGPRT